MIEIGWINQKTGFKVIKTPKYIKSKRAAPQNVARFLFHVGRLTPAACGSSLPAPRAAPFPGKAPSLPKV